MRADCDVPARATVSYPAKCIRHTPCAGYKGRKPSFNPSRTERLSGGLSQFFGYRSPNAQAKICVNRCQKPNPRLHSPGFSRQRPSSPGHRRTKRLKAVQNKDNGGPNGTKLGQNRDETGQNGTKRAGRPRDDVLRPRLGDNVAERSTTSQPHRRAASSRAHSPSFSRASSRSRSSRGK